MNVKCLTICSALGLLVLAAACESKNPAVPSAPGGGTAVQPAVVDVTIASPTLSSADGAQIKNVNQPVTLTIGSTIATGSRQLTYTIEVATDAAFSNIVYTKSGLAAGASQVIDKLPPGATYYWRARAMSGSLPGPNSKLRSFTIGPQVILSTPVPGSPGSSATLGSQVTLTVGNVHITGPAGPVVYRFQVADSPAFSNVVFEATVPEQGGGATSVNVTAKLTNGTYWWRVQASDASNAVTTAYSAATSFKVQTFSMAEATMVDAPFDLASWAETATITTVQFFPGEFYVDFSKRTGPDRWPDVPFGSGGSLEYTLGLCLNLNSHWFCSAPIQYWFGRDNGATTGIAANWFYDGRWGPMAGYQPSLGEIVGIFVAAGNLRDNTQGDRSYVKERSNVALMPWGENYSVSESRAPGAVRLLAAPGHK